MDVLVESPSGQKIVVPVPRPANNCCSSYYNAFLDAVLSQMMIVLGTQQNLQEASSSTTNPFIPGGGEGGKLKRRLRRQIYFVHMGKVLNESLLKKMFSSAAVDDDLQARPCSQQGTTKTATRSITFNNTSLDIFPPLFQLKIRILGGMDRQNRVGSKFGGGGVSSSQQGERERKERLKQLALESVDLAKDPYLVRNHLGSYECKLCLTLHRDEANYLAHTQGKKHQAGLARRVHLDKLRAEREEQQSSSTGTTSGRFDVSTAATPSSTSVYKKVRIGRPAYQVFKSRQTDTNQRCLSFELLYPEIEEGLQPRHRFMSAFEQKVESPPDRRYQYLLFAAEPYETVAFKIPNEPIDKGENRFVTYWDEDNRKFIVTLYFLNPKNEEEGGETKQET